MFQGQPSRHNAVFFKSRRRARPTSEQPFVGKLETDHLGTGTGGAL
ncbi:MAG: hypothetical protein RL768_2624 [Nitrospirota bacterium]|jgi:hypothetical protein